MSEPISEYDGITVGLISRIVSTAERVLGRNLDQGADPAVADALVSLANDVSVKQLLKVAGDMKKRSTARQLDSIDEKPSGDTMLTG